MQISKGSIERTIPRLTMLIWSREKDTPMIGGLGEVLFGHVDLTKWYKILGAHHIAYPRRVFYVKLEWV